jgi:HTH-type transcriptional regulator/antitoxin HigA
MATRSRANRKKAVKTLPHPVSPAGDRYVELVRECPLRVIRSEPEYERAIAMLDRLSDLGPARTAGETEYLLSLAVFVEKFEDEHHAMPPVSGPDMLRYLLQTNELTQSTLASATGLSVSTISEILAGKRALGVKHITSLARYFGVKPSVFLDG